MTTLVLWVPFTVLGTVRTLPMLVRGGLLSFDFADHVTSPANFNLSPSLLASRGAAARRLSDACAPASGDVGDPWGWRSGIVHLHSERSRKKDAARVLRDAREFIEYLVVSGVVPQTGPGLVAFTTRGSLRLGRTPQRNAYGLLAHIMPGSGPVTGKAILPRNVGAWQ